MITKEEPEQQLRRKYAEKKRASTTQIGIFNNGGNDGRLAGGAGTSTRSKLAPLSRTRCSLQRRGRRANHAIHPRAHSFAPRSQLAHLRGPLIPFYSRARASPVATCS